MRAGVELFVERGYDETTLAEIAEPPASRPRTIFAYFPSKEDILFSTIGGDVRRAHVRSARAAGRRRRADSFARVHPFVRTGEDGARLQARPRGHRRSGAGRPSSRRIGQLQEVLAAAIADDLGVGRDDRRPQIAAASLTAAFELLELDVQPGEWKAPTREEVAAAVDPVFAFVRAGLDATTAQA